jgi:hypothetical protein
MVSLELIERVGDYLYQFRPVFETQSGVAIYVQHLAPPLEVAAGEMLFPGVEDEEG